MEVRDRRVTTEDMARAAENKRDMTHSKEQSIPLEDRHETEKHRERRANGDGEDRLSPLFSEQEAKDFRSRWSSIQTGFVDEPRKSVEQADELVAQTMQRLAESFSQQKKQLETAWEKSEAISTEELRIALRRYRSFFDRLLSV